MRVLLTFVCSVMLLCSTCVAATFTTQTETYTRGDYTLDVEYPYIELENEKATSLVNDLIGMNLKQTSDAFLNPKEGQSYDGGKCTYTVTYNGENYISFITTSVCQHKGAAHPMVSYHGYIYDAQTGHGHSFEDLYNNGEPDADVSGVVDNGIHLYRDDSLYTGKLLAPVNRKRQNAYINKDGVLCLLFSPYALGEWVAGTLYIPVCPISDL